jgi:hypothetical protein
MKDNFLRLDLIFSYWIVAWLGLYLGGFVRASPKLPILLGALENIGTLLYLLIRGVRSSVAVYFFGINLLLKGIPLLLVWKDTVRLNDVWILLAVWSAYVLWLWVNGESVSGVYRELINGFLERPGGKRSAIRAWFEALGALE